ncbi:MAG: hypothetical protein WEH44_07390 [Pirellulaceae bacterium]
MRRMLPCAVIAVVLASAAFAQAGDGCGVAAPTCGIDGDACGAGCGRGGCGLFGRRCGRGGDGIEGLDPHFNCGCRGSYNYPVPPQYTYHWPGMYKQNLMTDYTSPWRFPPLKPYVDEQPVQSAESVPAAMIRTISAMQVVAEGASRSGQIESISSRLSRARR